MSSLSRQFAVVVVLFALAVGVQSSVFPFPYVWGGAHVPAAVTVAASPWPAAVAVGHPGPVQVVTGPAVVPVPAVVAHGPASFVAKTRGAVHVAPLPGHLNSVASVNLQPAPGTW